MIKGLTEKEAAERQKVEGFNELPMGKRRGIWYYLMEVLREPMFLLLVCCGVLYLLLGSWEDGLILIFFACVSIVITMFQQQKTERALAALRNLSNPMTRVIRDGMERKIASRELVRGDLMVLKEGDRISADGVVVEGVGLSVDESLLTGESVSVMKVVGDEGLAMGLAGGEGTPFVFSGTLVLGGRCLVRVKEVGLNSALGKIGGALSGIKQGKGLIDREVKKIVWVMALVGILASVLIVLIYGLWGGGWYAGVLAGLTLAMAMLPEEFPLVLTVFMAVGAWRMAKYSVLVRRLSVIENLGTTTVLCTDKTGTLTENKMVVQRLWAGGTSPNPSLKGEELVDFHKVDWVGGVLPEDFHLLVEYGILASQKNPFDPMEKSIIALGNLKLEGTEHIHTEWKLVKEYPLSKELLSMSHVWSRGDGGELIVAVKGAPEAVIDLCHLDETKAEAIEAKVKLMGEDGLRVLGVGRGVFRGGDLPMEQHSFDFHFEGLIGLADPIRENVKESVRDCLEAGVRVVMITGDYLVTAQAIGREIGLQSIENCLTGAELSKMDNETLQKRIGEVGIFSRVSPEQKLRIVNALRANGEIVSMTGDGVNDAPALKAADIGIAMGGKGTEVAREAASIVILDDDFSSIVKGIGMGRRIVSNLQKAMAYILAIHIPIVGVAFMPILLGGVSMIFMPLHIVFMEMIIDPACSVVFEADPEEKDSMKKPPRDRGKSLFGLTKIVISLMQGLSVLLQLFLVFDFGVERFYSEDKIRAMVFGTMVVGNLMLILTNRSWVESFWTSFKRPNVTLYLMLGGVLLLLVGVVYIPFLQIMFHFESLPILDFMLCLFAGVIGVIWFELLKILGDAFGGVKRFLG